jgi:uncharacterized protein (UPF0303 family)
MTAERVKMIVDKNCGIFSRDDIEMLRQQENLLRFSAFGSADALAIGQILARLSAEYPEQLAVVITREADQTVIFQYVMDEKKQRNLNFAAGKRNAVLASGHSSLLTLAEACEGNIPDALLKEDEVIIPVGGAFPVFVDGVHTATIAVSGLHEGKDHEIIVRALAEYLNIDLPAYKGYLV